MSITRKLIASTAIAAALSVLPISIVATNMVSATGTPTSTTQTVSLAGGQGNWPLKR